MQLPAVQTPTDDGRLGFMSPAVGFECVAKHVTLHHFAEH